MLYQLPDGRTIEISAYDLVTFTDEELASLIGYSYIGDYINNPFYGSAINKPGRSAPVDYLEDLDLDTIHMNDEDYLLGGE